MDKLCGWAAVNFEQKLHALGQPGCASMLQLFTLSNVACLGTTWLRFNAATSGIA